MLTFDLRAVVLLLVAVAVLLAAVVVLLARLRRAQAAERAALATAAAEAERRAEEARELLATLTEANRILREREQGFRLTFDRSPLGAALVALDGRFLRVNAALEAITGYQEGALLRRDVFAVVTAQDRPVAEALARALLDGDERVRGEVRAERADGAPIWLQLTGGLVCGENGEPLHILILAEDISERREAQAASAANKARLFAEVSTAAAEQERRRLARELHDSVSQALFAASRITETLPRLWELDPDEGRQALASLHRFTSSALAEMRALLVELRPPALVEAPLHETLAVLAPTLRARGVEQVYIALDRAPLLPPEVQIALYRIAQEALNNVTKHARAQRVDLSLAISPVHNAEEPWEGAATLTVLDDGCGFISGLAAGGRFGLATMQERAAEINARFDLHSRPGTGTRIKVTWCGASFAPADLEENALRPEGMRSL